MKKALVTGASGFIGSHLITFLKAKGYEVTAVSKYKTKYEVQPDYVINLDLRNPTVYGYLFSKQFDEVYNLAANMGGIGHITQDQITSLHDSNLINIYLVKACSEQHPYPKVFFSSSACVYPKYKQNNLKGNLLKEEDAYPADPTESYGWEKLLAERRYLAYRDTFGIKVAIARFGNCYGPGAAYEGGKDKAPAALCRKIAKAADGDAIEIWGDGKQVRTFMYVDDCIKGIYALMQSDYQDPINIGSNYTISINELARLIIDISGKKLTLKHIDGPQGVRGRFIDHSKAVNFLDWSANTTLQEGMEKTYEWINGQINS